jgi:hypothetical protein
VRWQGHKKAVSFVACPKCNGTPGAFVRTITLPSFLALLYYMLIAPHEPPRFKKLEADKSLEKRKFKGKKEGKKKRERGRELVEVEVEGGGERGGRVPAGPGLSLSVHPPRPCVITHRNLFRSLRPFNKLFEVGLVVSSSSGTTAGVYICTYKRTGRPKKLSLKIRNKNQSER